MPVSLATTPGITNCFLFLRGTKMFQFPGFAPSHDGGRPSTCRVAPFGYSRIKSCLQIPATFRSLPRPSSPPDSLGILRSLLLPFSVLSASFPRSRRPASEKIARNNYFSKRISMNHFLPMKLQSLISFRFRKNSFTLTDLSFYLLLYLLIFSLSIVNDQFRETVFWYSFQTGLQR